MAVKRNIEAPNAQWQDDIDLATQNRIIASTLNASLRRGRHHLFDHQRDAVGAVARHLLSENGAPIMLPEGQEFDYFAPYEKSKVSDNCEIVSATGTGKTHILGALADGSSVNTLLLTPLKELNRQAFDSLCESLGVDEELVGRFDSDIPTRTKQQALKKPLLISTFKSLRKMVERDHDTGKWTLNKDLVDKRPLILIDEVHEAQGEGISEILNDLKEQSLVIGVTATDAGAADTLFDGQSPIYNYPLTKAVKDGLLAQGVQAKTISVALDADWVKKMRATKGEQEYSEADIEAFAREPSVLRALTEFHLNYENDTLGKIDRLPTIVFTQGIKAAREGAEYFNEQAIAAGSKARAAYISGTMTEDQRKGILADFRQGETSVLFNNRVLGIGVDLPEATVVYSLKPSRMRHTSEQQLGRAMRRQPVGYEETYGQDKVALAVNINPAGVFPYYFGDVIDGMPAIYSKEYAVRHDTTKPVEEKGVPEIEGVRFYTTEQDIAELRTEATQAMLDVLPLPESAWMMKQGAAKRIGIGHSETSAFGQMWNELLAQTNGKELSPQSTIDVKLGEHDITMGWFRNGPRPAWYVPESALPIIAAHLGHSMEPASPRPESGWMALRETQDSLHVGVHKFRPVWEKLVSSAESQRSNLRDGVVPILLGDQTIQMGWFKPKHGSTTWYISDRSVPALGAYLELPNYEIPTKPENGWSTRNDMQELLHVNADRIKPVWDALTESAERQIPRPADGIVTVEHDSKSVRMGHFRSTGSGRPHWYVHAGSHHVLAKALGVSLDPLPSRPNEGWCSRAEVVEALGVHRRHVIPLWDELIRLAESQGPQSQDGITPVEFHGETIRMGHFKPNAGAVTWYVEQEAIPALCRIFEENRGASGLVGRASSRSIAPDSEHIRNRSGRSRSTDD